MNTLRFYLLEAVTEYDERHRIAQHNASLPIESGGLGLHKDNNAKDRAKAMGFDVDKVMYRGLSQPHSDSHVQPFIWTSPDATHATEYAYNDNKNSTPNILPIYIKYKNPVHLGYRNSTITTTFKEVRDRIKQRILDTLQHTNDYKLTKSAFDVVDELPNKDGHKAVWEWRENTPEFKHSLDAVGYDSISDVESNGHEHYNTIGLFHPHQMRSVHAAFDPMKKESGDLLA